ncbi:MULTISPECIES: YeeE/YedE family protein [Vibrio]|uniref:YeeE/YedE family protein n=2 Tax=Unclassified Bacteria TaxID=49928 RepID=A0AAU6UVX9_UNCXX|nr:MULTISPECIES: YeeE/YedE family protein [Vibrio]EKO3570478.1 YeeE/YedE family protein [Vibrio metschnikovii]EKO3592991.1 YeeE/YedE family protein [Vibrio metschnikovii]EKO3605231.1 YeeE/YedE family protein [Vibrio metschnikovii]EKO3609800.1 YeeE/YedE family protein [Vibrio metschnikovii]EKO3627707.1 YeeE/YedE family protein [Vibrio metschnikovii]
MTFSIPWYSLFGGMLLGVSATLLLLLNGKVAGISGILGGLLAPKAQDTAWRWLFMIGLVAGGVFGVRLLGAEVPLQYSSSTGMLIIAGLLVGLGTRLGNGCTSGHGICGIGRLSLRSIVATGIFMLVAGITVFVRLHLL